MTSDFALALSKDMLWTALVVSAPILGFTLLIGLIISIFQVVTQIQEISLTFVPKIITVVCTLMILGPWMLGVIVQFAAQTIKNIPSL